MADTIINKTDQAIRGLDSIVKKYNMYLHEGEEPPVDPNGNGYDVHNGPRGGRFYDNEEHTKMKYPHTGPHTHTADKLLHNEQHSHAEHHQKNVPHSHS